MYNVLYIIYYVLCIMYYILNIIYNILYYIYMRVCVYAYRYIMSLRIPDVCLLFKHLFLGDRVQQWSTSCLIPQPQQLEILTIPVILAAL